MVPLDQTPAPAEPPESQAAGLKEKALRSLGTLPPFSLILTRLLATLAEESVSFSTIGDLIEKDTVVAGNILHLVNSALYARRSPVSSVRHAVSLLGINKLRNAVLGMSIARVWNRIKMPAFWSMARFNMHSAAVAVLADLLAQRLPVEYPEGAFVAGLLHDSGRLLIAAALPQEAERIADLYERGHRALIECEQEVLGFTHPALSAEALKYWKLPVTVQNAVRDHHLPPGPFTGEEIPLGHVVSAANAYVNSLGITILNRGSANPNPKVFEPFGLGPDKLQGLIDEFAAENQAMSGFFR